MAGRHVEPSERRWLWWKDPVPFLSSLIYNRTHPAYQTFTDRERGHSKMSLAVAFEELWLVTWWSLRDRPWWRKKKRQARPGHGTQEPKNASSA